MISNYTKNETVDTTGKMILEFDANEIDSVIFTPTVDVYWGFQDLSQALHPLLATASLTMTHNDFRNTTLEKIYAMIRKYIFRDASQEIQNYSRIIRVYAKGQLASSVISISYLGGNR